MIKAQQSYKMQKWLTAVTVALFLIKLYAWYLTNSVAILTDTLEYIVNVITGFMSLYSLRLSSRPRDYNHPYGHGKVEFITAAVEGTLMTVSGLLIIYEAINNLRFPHVITQLNYGIILVAITAGINYAMGYYAVSAGNKNGSLALTAEGVHMKSDTYATVGLIIGLLLLLVIKLPWIDSAVAMVFGVVIILNGYQILRRSVAGIMDEADNDLLSRMVTMLNTSRTENWVDMHNLRIIKYGSILHMDCHLTVPWYMNMHQAHKEIDILNGMLIKNFGDSIEMFVHTDGCLEFSCKICNKGSCTERKHVFEKRIEWTVSNISANSKHRAD